MVPMTASTTELLEDELAGGGVGPAVAGGAGGVLEAALAAFAALAGDSGGAGAGGAGGVLAALGKGGSSPGRRVPGDMRAS